MDSKYKGWEDKLKALKNAYEKELTEIRAAKQALYDEKSDKLQKLAGKFIQDDKRIVISAPEIIIGNVNMGGVLNPDGQGNLIIRGNNVFLEGAGDQGKLAMRAPVISQIAEDPGIDGEEHVVCDASKIVSQAREITIESNAVEKDGAFLAPDTTKTGSISIRADKDISIDAVKSKTTLAGKAKKITDEWTATGKTQSLNECTDALTAFENARKVIDDLLESRDKLKKGDDKAIRTDYRDLDEINIIIDELSLDLATRLYEYSKRIAKLAEKERQFKYYTKLQENLNGIPDDDFKKNKTETSVSINSEQINLSSVDGDGNRRTNSDAAVNVTANNVRFEGIYTNEGELEDTNKLSVNMRNISITSESKKNLKYEEGILKSGDYPSVGSVLIRSKDILLENTDYEMVDKKYREKNMTDNGSILLRSKTIGLDTNSTSDIETDEKGEITKATYTPDGNIIIYTKDLCMESVGVKLDGGKSEFTGLAKDSSFRIHTENFAFSAADKEGKASGTASINAKEVNVRSVDVDPNTQEIKQVAAGGKISVVGEATQNYGTQKAEIFSDKQMTVYSLENTLVQGAKTTEMTQDGNVVRLEGGKVEISGSKNTLFGETTINVLKSPSVNVVYLTASKAIKAPNITDGVMVDTKNTSTSNAKNKAEEPKKPEEGAADKAAATADADRNAAASKHAELWKKREKQTLEDN